MEIRYPAVLELEEGDGFFVRFVDVKGAMTDGETRDEALFNASEALSAVLGWMLDENQLIPDPSPAEEGMVLVAPDARTQAALLIRRARGDRSLAELARAANLVALGATAGESPPLPDPASTGKSGGSLGQAAGAGAGLIRRSSTLHSSTRIGAMISSQRVFSVLIDTARGTFSRSVSARYVLIASG